MRPSAASLIRPPSRDDHDQAVRPAGRHPTDARFRARNPVGFGAMAAWDHTRFRDYVLAAAAELRLTSPADIARAAGLHQSLLSKWFAGSEQPSTGSLGKLAAAIRVPTSHLLVLAGRAAPEDVGLSEQPTLTPVLADPLARELDHLLSARSRLSDADRDRIRSIIDAVLAPHRRSAGRGRSA